jgi:predicted lipid-binding transport protein (Tim44 family)
MSFKKGSVVAVLLAGLIAFAPAIAEAAAGRGSSMGSRGARTYQPNAAAPMQRSTTAPQQRQAPTAQQQPGVPGGMAAPARPGFGMGSPIMTGIMAGLAGSFIGNMLFGSSAAAQTAANPEASSTGTFLGGMLPFLLLGGLGFLAFTMFRRRNAASSPQALARGPVDLSGLRGGAGAGLGGGMMGGAAASPDLAVGQDDYETFGRLLVEIQSAWGRGDAAALKPLVTPEMSAYFAGQLAELKAEGLTNKVEDVTLLKGDVAESWAEGNDEYVTANLRWSARDYTVDAAGKVTQGDASQPVETAEVWTFVRTADSDWRLSAIQQL